jgi:hypothetical protein
MLLIINPSVPCSQKPQRDSYKKKREEKNVTILCYPLFSIIRNRNALKVPRLLPICLLMRLVLRLCYEQGIGEISTGSNWISLRQMCPRLTSANTNLT